jgi:NAD(P)H-quinone oxidoreductase subunit 5
MMTQSSIKQALAYSTIAQMGFMMLQCGLGAFTAAMLHLIAHSLYKAHAFLNSGSVVSQAASMRGAEPTTGQVDSSSPRSSLGLLAVAAATFLVYLSASTLLGFDFTKKPGAFVFTFTLCLALMTWGWRVLRAGTAPNVIGGLLSLAALCVIYMGGYMAVGAVLGGSVPSIGISSAALAVNAAIAIAFCGLLALHFTIIRKGQPRWLDALRVHASSGFYVDSLYRRLFHSAAS